MFIFLQTMKSEARDNDDDEDDNGLTAGMSSAIGTASFLLFMILLFTIRHGGKLQTQYKLKTNVYELWESGSKVYRPTTTTILYKQRDTIHNFIVKLSCIP